MKKNIVCMILAIMLIFVASGCGNKIKQPESKNIDDSPMQIGYKDIYADVVSFTPASVMLARATDEYGNVLPNSGSNRNEVILLCRTEAGKEFYMTMFDHQYTGNIIYAAQMQASAFERLTMNETSPVQFDKPIRIRGYIVDPESYFHGEAKSIKGNYLFKVETIEDIPKDIKYLPQDDLTADTVVTINPEDVSLQQGESVCVTVSVTGELPENYYFNCSGENCADLISGEWLEFSEENTAQIRLTGMKSGECELTFKVIDGDTDEPIARQVEAILHVSIQ